MLFHGMVGADKTARALEAEWARGEGDLAVFFEAGQSQFKAEDCLVVEPWNGRENTLNVGRMAHAAWNTGNAELTLNAETVASAEARGAPVLEVARKRFNDYFPLLRLDRHGEGG